MPLPLLVSDELELPIGTHGIFKPDGAGYKEIGHIFVKLNPDRLFWHDWETTPAPPPDEFYVLQNHSNGDADKPLWNKYQHSNLVKTSSSISPSDHLNDNGGLSAWKVWKITYGNHSTTSGEVNGHPYSAGTLIGYFALKNSNAAMDWWIKVPYVDLDSQDPLEGLVKFNTPSQHHPCLHFARLNPIGNIPADFFFQIGHSPLS